MKIRRFGTVAFLASYLALATARPVSLSGFGASSSANAGFASDRLLTRNYIVLLDLVNQYFETITRQDSTGKDSTAQGDPNATRAVFFTNGDASQKVTITVDRYRNSADATSAYQLAVQLSEEVPGFQPISIPSVGQQSFAGTVTQAAETHVGLGALDGNFVIGATLAGFDATADDVANLVGLARAEDAAVAAAAGCRQSAN